MKNPSNKIESLDIIAEKTMLKETIFVNGCFDLLHSGHVFLLNHLKEKNPSKNISLVVGINSDTSVKKLKGDKRPINSQKQRSYLLASLECVDHVFIFSDTSVEKQIEKLEPFLWGKGPDYNEHKLDPKELAALRAVGGKMLQIKDVPEELFSNTSKTIKKIEENNS